VQGEVPLGSQWSFDWLAGAAVLYGERNLQQTATATTGGVSITVAQNSSDSRAIFNVDAQAGLSYWFSPSLKATVGYRFDGYFKALKTFIGRQRGGRRPLLQRSGGAADIEVLIATYRVHPCSWGGISRLPFFFSPRSKG
jgi:hypothetical protein